MAQRATKHGVHQMMMGEWRKQAMEGTARAFSGKEAAREQDVARSSEAEVERPHAKIGELLVERDFLKAFGR